MPQVELSREVLRALAILVEAEFQKELDIMMAQRFIRSSGFSAHESAARVWRETEAALRAAAEEDADAPTDA